MAAVESDQLVLLLILGGALVVVAVVTWPAVSTFVRGVGDARRAAEAVAAGRVGDAVVERLRVGSLRVNGARLVDLDLLVREPGRAEFRTRVRTLVDEFLASQVQPGAVLRVGRPRADRDEVVLLP